MGNELNGLSSCNNRNNWNKKKGILAGFLLFMGFMLVCTVVAKGIYRNGLPRVRLCQVEKRSIHYEINGVGNILPGETYGVYAPQGLRVHTASVRTGEQIQEGDVLFELDTDDLERCIQETTAGKNYLKAQINDLAGAQNQQKEEKKKLEERLLADYDNLAAKQDLLVNNAELAAESARLRMKEAKDNDEYSALDYNLYKKEYERAENALEQARIDREEAIRDWNRSLEDARADIGSVTAERVRLSGELAERERTLEQLERLKEAQGRVLAGEAGTVLSCGVETGGRTPDGACVLYTKTGDGVEVRLSEEDGQRLSIGDKVSLQCKASLGETRRFDGIVCYQENRSGQYLLRIEADVSGLPAGQTVSMNYSCSSESYDMVIPISALHGDISSTYYVYVVEEVEGILGTEHRTRKITVTVLEKNGGYAAIRSAALGPDSEIVEHSNKEFAENAAVRVMEE